MNYLFIDCEVANKNDDKPKICQFGYILTDENFTILNERNIYINPGVGQDFSNIEERKIKIDYSENNYKFYHQQKMFSSFYEDIKNQLTQEDILVIGWAIQNDAFYLLSECDRYRKEQFDFSCFDLQQICDSLHGNKRSTKLKDNVLEELLETYPEHNALNDCHLTLEVLKDILKSYQWTFDDFRRKCFKPSFFKASEAFAKEWTAYQYKENNKGLPKTIQWKSLKRYVFFDLESAVSDGGVGKICEYGVVITDENFNIVTKNFFTINPKSKFRLLGRGNRRDLHLYGEANDYELYKKSPELIDYYDRIKETLTLPNSIVFGHSVDNDIGFLATDLQRSKLNQIIFKAIDTQEIAGYIMKPLGTKKPSLETAFDHFVGEKERKRLHAHKAVDDAMMTMLLMKAMVKSTGKSLEELVKEIPNCTYSSEFYIQKFNSRLNKTNTIDVQAKTPDMYSLKRQKNKCPGVVITNEAKKQDAEKSKDPCFIGRRYVISNTLQHEEEQMTADSINKIHDGSNIIVNTISQADYIVVRDQADIDYILTKLKNPISARFVIAKELLSSN